MIYGIFFDAIASLAFGSSEIGETYKLDFLVGFCQSIG